VKRCSHCGEVKPLDAFHKNRAARDGRRHDCKECNKARVREYQRRMRAELGDDAWKARRRDAMRRHRETSESDRDYLQVTAYGAAQRRLREAHRDEFETYYDEELAARGLRTRAS
jgi:hypothetical protein